jgi:hypothetical protein
MVDAKEIKVPDIQPAGFVIEILDNEQDPVAKGIKFSVAIDDENAKIIEIKEDGILRVVPEPQSKINLSLVGREVITTSESKSLDEPDSNFKDPV